MNKASHLTTVANKDDRSILSYIVGLYITQNDGDPDEAEVVADAKLLEKRLADGATLSDQVEFTDNIELESYRHLLDADRLKAILNDAEGK